MENSSPEKQLKDLIVKTLDYHTKQVAKYTNLLKTIEDDNYTSPIVREKPVVVNVLNPKSFAGIVLACFKDVPLTSRELYNEYNRQIGKTSVFASFSSQLSSLTKPNTGRLKKHVFEGNPIDKKYYYGKTEWFDGESLKTEYLNKISAVDWQQMAATL
jgi:hypothetical protein